MREVAQRAGPGSAAAVHIVQADDRGIIGSLNGNGQLRRSRAAMPITDHNGKGDVPGLVLAEGLYGFTAGIEMELVRAVLAQDQGTELFARFFINIVEHARGAVLDGIGERVRPAGTVHIRICRLHLARGDHFCAAVLDDHMFRAFRQQDFAFFARKRGSIIGIIEPGFQVDSNPVLRTITIGNGQLCRVFDDAPVIGAVVAFGGLVGIGELAVCPLGNGEDTALFALNGVCAITIVSEAFTGAWREAFRFARVNIRHREGTCEVGMRPAAIFFLQGHRIAL